MPRGVAAAGRSTAAGRQRPAVVGRRPGSACRLRNVTLRWVEPIGDVSATGRATWYVPTAGVPGDPDVGHRAAATLETLSGYRPGERDTRSWGGTGSPVPARSWVPRRGTVRPARPQETAPGRAVRCHRPRAPPGREVRGSGAVERWCRARVSGCGRRHRRHAGAERASACAGSRATPGTRVGHRPGCCEGPTGCVRGFTAAGSPPLGPGAGVAARVAGRRGPGSPYSADAARWAAMSSRYQW